MKNLNPIKILISSLLFMPFAILAIEADLPPPEVLIGSEDLYPAEEVLYLEGRARPGALIEVRLEKSGQEMAVIPALAGDSGNWLISQKLPLPSGNYDIKARQSLANLISEWSAPKPLRAVSTGVWLFGKSFLYAFVGMASAILVLPLTAFLVYFWWRVRLYKKRLR